MPTNEDYLQLWEDSAPTPVDSGTVGKRGNKRGWKAYDEEMDDLGITPELQKEIDEYATKHHDSSTAQTKEELQRFKEMNAEAAKEYQFVTPDEYNNVEERTGRVMHSSEFIKRLMSAGVKCHYKQHPHKDKLTLIIMRNNVTEVGCWVQAGNMPELSIMNFDEQGIPLAEKFRGWRTCLLQLILKSVITERKADKIFGAPKKTAAFHRYNALLQSFRNAGSSLKKEE